MIRLYRATIEIYVIGENETEAKVAASQADEHYMAWEVKEVSQDDVIPEEWGNALPWGTEDEEWTCTEILLRQAGPWEGT